MGFDIDYYLEKAKAGELLDEYVIKLITLELRNMLENQPNVVSVPTPVICIGDIHGQFFDLLEIFKIGGSPPDVSYLFLGDFVDRGPCCIETITLLSLLKLRYPQRITLLRGNHETRSITQVYGFFAECQRKFGNPSVWQYFTDAFDFLPISAVIQQTLFCVHGGLSPSISRVDEIRRIERTQEIPHEGGFSDLMWSDPDENNLGFSTSSRGAGYMFGKDIVDKFLHMNDISHIIRAHQLCNDGYQVLFDDTFSTVWSAPNYCFRFKNMASILLVDERLNRQFVVFSEAPENSRYEVNKIFEAQPDNFLI
ncbi:unnamed protein product [Blepharisma stoltei]|uniref:Serine/threonine-protein phosphatase n=1 Tax=Blepharisma stoltei TaxID=1481888 RepID=A0AAU9K0E4_9CILI|nr:unnamed protein product [Blepharisma stoltei]